MKIKVKYLDNNFYMVSAQAAAKLLRAYADNSACTDWDKRRILPREGYQRKAIIRTAIVGTSEFYALEMWITRTVNNSKTVWAVHIPGHGQNDPLNAFRLHLAAKETGYWFI